MDTLQAAVLLAKIDAFTDELKVRERVGQRYTSLIEETSNGIDPVRRIVTPYVKPYNTSVYAQYTVRVPDREAVQTAMKARGIPTAVHYPVPLHLQPAFESLGLAEGSLPVSEKVARHVISLPMHPYLTAEQAATVVSALTEAVNA